MNTKTYIDQIRDTYNKLAIDATFLPGFSSHLNEEDLSDCSCHRAFILGLLKIEQLVFDILSSKEPAYSRKEVKPGKFQVLKHPLSKYFLDVNDLFRYLYDIDYQYSAHVSLFFNCCFRLDLGNEELLCPTRLTAKGARQFELFNELIELIRIESQGRDFQSHLRRQTEKPRIRLKSARRLIGKMLDKRTRFDAIRIDLSFRYDLAADITLQEAKSNVARFFNNRRHKSSLFEKYLGGLWKLEWAPLKGYHFHLLLFFKDIEKDAQLAFLLIDYWKRVITHGKGIGFNCNAKKHEYQRLGIGRIERRDYQKIEILIEDVIGYMAKTDQALLATRLKGERVFMPCPGPKRGRGGRPRMDA